MGACCSPCVLLLFRVCKCVCVLWFLKAACGGRGPARAAAKEKREKSS